METETNASGYRPFRPARRGIETIETRFPAPRQSAETISEVKVFDEEQQNSLLPGCATGQGVRAAGGVDRNTDMEKSKAGAERPNGKRGRKRGRKPGRAGEDNGNCAMNGGFCASIAALVVALDEAGALHRDRYDEILRHFWAKLPDDGDGGNAGTVIEQVLDRVAQYSRGQTGRPVDLDAIRRSLAVQLPASAADDRRTEAETVGNERASRHEPLLGAPFVV